MPVSNRIGDHGQGAHIAMNGINGGRLNVGKMSTVSQVNVFAIDCERPSFCEAGRMPRAYLKL